MSQPDSDGQRRPQTDKATDLEVAGYLFVRVCVCLPLLLPSHFAAGYCQALKCPLSSSLPQAIEVPNACGDGGGGGVDCVTLGFVCHLSRHQEDNIPTFNP